VAERSRHGERAVASARRRHLPPLELAPFSDEWRAWYAERRLFSSIDLLNDNDARRGIMPPLEKRARERRRGSSGR